MTTKFDIEPLLPAIEVALRQHGISATRFGYLAVGDPALVRRLRDGMVLRPRRRARVETFLTSLRVTRMNRQQK